MKKGLFTLLILVMAFGNVGFAQQRKASLKSNATANVFKHYGVRDETTVVPQVARWKPIWDEPYRTTYIYDEYDYYLIEELTEIFEDNNWLNVSLLTYEYDFSGNVLEMLMQWAEDGDWVNEAHALYSYDNDELSEVIIQYWDGNEWVNETKEVYNYIGDVTTVLYWDWNGNNWTSDELYTYTYGNGTMELLIQYMQGGAWQNDEKQTYTFDFEENIIEILVEDWQDVSWVNARKVTYNYDGGVYTSQMVQGWVNNGWVDGYRYSFDYSEGNAIHGICEQKNGDEWVMHDGEIEMAYGYNAAVKTYSCSEVDITYIDLTSLNENAQTSNFKVYPVPAENEIQIQAESFQKAEIYSITGQKLMESLQNRMNVSELSSGLYMIKVYDCEGGCATQRFVVK